MLSRYSSSKSSIGWAPNAHTMADKMVDTKEQKWTSRMTLCASGVVIKAESGYFIIFSVGLVRKSV